VNGIAGSPTRAALIFARGGVEGGRRGEGSAPPKVSVYQAAGSTRATRIIGVNTTVSVLARLLLTSEIRFLIN